MMKQRTMNVMDNEYELKFRSNGLTLVGSVVDAEDATAIALLITGSGKLNRDSNHAKLNINVSYALASYLSKLNISSFRYDKRGVGDSDGDYWTTTLSDNFDDANAAICAIKTIYPDKCLYIVGHSEGSLIAAHVAAKRNDLSGIVLLAGSTRKGSKLLSWQLGQVLNSLQGVNKWLLKILPINLVKLHQKLLKKIQLSHKKTMHIMGVKKINAGWLREFMEYDPVDDYCHISCPVLAISGKKDIQVPVDDLLHMKKIIINRFEGYAIDDLTHLLRKDVDKPSINNYKKLIEFPVDDEVLRIVGEWIDSLSK